MTRLDAELVRRGLVRSRTRAAGLVRAGRVRVAGSTVAKVSARVDPDAEIDVDASPQAEYVSRGGHKLAGALADLADLGLALPVDGARCLDAGASTGGFTQVLLDAGAAEVVAVDVGHGQLDPEVSSDTRVTSHEGVNVRDMDPGLVGDPVQILVADLSFISLTIVLPALVRSLDAGGHALVLVKPQFEVGKERLGAGGVARSDALRADAVRSVASAVPEAFDVVALVPSRLAGSAGNQEIFMYLRGRGPARPSAAIGRGAHDPSSMPGVGGRERRSAGGIDAAIAKAVGGVPAVVVGATGIVAGAVTDGKAD